jgi:hypothetical protein
MESLQNNMQNGGEPAVEALELGHAPGQQRLIDPFGRAISYLRVSVTDRCDFRCVYCMAENMSFLPKSEILTLEELDRLCSAFIARGVRKLRLTGGEPLVRRGIMTLVNSLSRHLHSGSLDELMRAIFVQRAFVESTFHSIHLMPKNSQPLPAGGRWTKCSPGSMRRKAPGCRSRSTRWLSKA